jgi:Heparinase II/III-like protein
MFFRLIKMVVIPSVILPFAAYGLAVSAPNSNPVSPLRGLRYSAKDIMQMRKSAIKDPDFKAVAQSFLGKAAGWLQYSDAEIKAFLPPKDGVYAYGFAGDPKTNRSWPRFGKKICSLDLPLQVKSPFTGTIYGIQGPGEPYYDPGDGWVRPGDGKRFYFKGVWNSYVIRQLHGAIDHLAVAYALTGDEAVAARALLIFDYLAKLRPLCNPNGAVDNIRKYMKNYGFFCYMGNLANHRMVKSAEAFDLLAKSSAAGAQSKTNPDLTIFQNIRQNYFAFFERPNNERELKSLQNHAQSMAANVLTQAVLFGEPVEDLKFGIDCIYASIDNTIDRDGESYEVSGAYSNTGRYYINAAISSITNYSPANYENPAKMPDPNLYPYKLKFGDHPKWYKYAVKSLYRTEVLGREPNYGDSKPDRKTTNSEVSKSNLSRRSRYLKTFYTQTTLPKWQKECIKLYRELPVSTRRNKGTKPIWSIRDTKLLSNPEWVKLLMASSSSKSRASQLSTLLGAKVIGILRSGRDKQKRALFIRGGANASHAHDDQLGIILYAKGMELSGEFGYNLYGRADHLGFGSRAIAHNTVVIDEDLPPSKIWKRVPSANVTAYLSTKPAQFIEMSTPKQWQKTSVTDYHRLCWLIDISKKDFYYLDFFHIKGGKRHDYAWNARYLDPAVPGDGLTLEGVKPKNIPGIWTLAALGGSNLNATFNKPGQSWGERLRPGGHIQKLGIKGEKIGYFNWNPPPGNGYGFVYNIKTAKTTKNWSAIWALGDKAKNKMKITMLNGDSQTVITGKTPTLDPPETHHAIVISRRQQQQNKPLHSNFVNVIQVSNGKWPVKSAKLIKQNNPNATAVKIALQSGSTDTVIDCENPGSETKCGNISLKGKYGFIRQDKTGQVINAIMNSASRLSGGGLTLELVKPYFEAKVTEVKIGLYRNRVVIDKSLPVGSALSGNTALLMSSPQARIPYAHNEYYKIAGIAKSPQGKTIVDLGMQDLYILRNTVKTVKKDGTIIVKWPMELGFFPTCKALQGRQVWVKNRPSAITRIKKLISKNRFIVDNSAKIQPGDEIEIRTIQAGDIIRIPAFAALKKVKAKTWQLKANQNIKIIFPAKKHELVLLNTAGGKISPQLYRKSGNAKLEIPLEVFNHGPVTLKLQ